MATYKKPRKPKKPKAGASIATMENYIKRYKAWEQKCREIEKAKAKRASLRDKISKL